MLKDKLYSVISISDSEGKIVADIKLNKEDEIFKGHFPNQPVLPGACMLQILKEVLQSALNKKIRLKKADQMKFLSIVDPNVNNALQLNISYTKSESEILVNATMGNTAGANFKFKGIFLNL
jgi:3-hydroxyacyl-[acyl-carrier-protein] dehydratase